MPRRLLIEHIKMLFSETRKSSYWIQVRRFPLLVRYALGVLLILFGLLGMLTPIPAGVVFLVIGVALLVGLRRARSWLLSFVSVTRLHILYGKIYTWWQLRKR